MALEVYLTPEALPEYVAAAAMAALAVWLIWLDPRRLPNLAFALFLVCRAAATVSFTFEQLASQPGQAELASALRWEHARAALTIATVVSLLLFAALYPRPRARTGRLVALLFAGLVALEAAYLTWPWLWATYTTEAGLLAHTTVGPFYAFQLLRVPAFGLVVFLFAHDWTRTPSGPAASALLLVGLAFGLHATYDASNAGLLLLVHGAELPFWTRLEIVLDVVSIVPVAAGAVLLARAARRRRAHERASVRRVLYVLPLPILTNALVLLTGGAGGGQDATRLFFLGVWRLSLPLIATYALVRFGLFDLDVRIKRTLHRVVVAALFVLVFFAVSEGAESLLGRAGRVYGVLTAAVLALLLTPLERFADRVADAAMPHVASTNELTRHERRALYRDLARSALESGRVSADERRLLAVAQRHLGLRTEDTQEIESELAPRKARAPASVRGHRRT
jgi:hypothetical protein